MFNKIKNILVLLLVITCIVFIFLYKQQQNKVEDLQTKINGLPSNVEKKVTIEKNTIKTVYRDKVTGETKTKTEYVPHEGKVQIIVKRDEKLEQQYKEAIESKSQLERALLESNAQLQLVVDQGTAALKEKQDKVNSLKSEIEALSLDSSNSDLILAKQKELEDLLKDTENLQNNLNLNSEKIRQNLVLIDEKNKLISNLQNQILQLQQPVITSKKWGFVLWDPQLSLIYNPSLTLSKNSFEPSFSNRFFYCYRFGTGLGISPTRAYLFGDYVLDQLYLNNTSFGLYIGKDWKFNTVWGLKFSVFF